MDTNNVADGVQAPEVEVEDDATDVVFDAAEADTLNTDAEVVMLPDAELVEAATDEVEEATDETAVSWVVSPF